MRPAFRAGQATPRGFRPSAVLVPIVFRGGGPSLILIERAPGGFHGGQIAFPGGAEEEGDGGPVGTALREAREEIGLHPGSVDVLGLLSPLTVIVSRFLIQPVVGLVAERPVFEPSPDEVAGIIEVPLAELAGPGNKREREIDVRGESRTVPCYQFGKTVVWGVTAMMLSELEELLRRL
jgi:8-oxo-dGTP pyrophosphatase MutT (NUDIX family)